MFAKINLYFKSLYDKALTSAQKLVARQILFCFAFIESIIFPIPVDPLLAFLVLANKNKFVLLTLICTIGSVLGGVIGWIIGFHFGPEIQKFLITVPWFSEEMFNQVIEAHNEKGSLIVFLGAFTPLPFKLIAITSGFFGVNLLTFILMALIGRSIRFFIISLLVKIFGDYAINLIKEKLFIVTSALGVVIIIIFYFFKL